MPDYNSFSVPETVAAIDLGSNSFHLIVAKINGGQLQVIDRLREMVRLREGLTEDKALRPEVEARALACLERFGQRLRDMQPGSVRTVGTNTLRQIRGDYAFLERAERALGHPIDVIAGREEARLIYLGVAHGLAAGDEQRLVVDIGGGSTEVIIGRGFNAQHRESLHMGCVSMTLNHFPEGRITEKNMQRAVFAGRLELRPVRAGFRATGWDRAVGSSGTIRAIRTVVQEAGWCDQGITSSALKKLRRTLTGFRHMDEIELKGLSPERRPVFPGGVAVLSAVFKALDIKQMLVSDEALREGLLYDMLGRARHQDIREATVQSLAKRYSIDKAQAKRVEATALALLEQVKSQWNLDREQYANMLRWAAQLHEIGLAVSHSRFQHHGAYLVRNLDLSGFSRQEQAILATLILGHRRKFPTAAFDKLSGSVSLCTKQLCLLLRLAVLMHRGRSATSRPVVVVESNGDQLSLTFPDGWLKDHPLTSMELEQEAKRVKNAGFKIFFK